MVLGILKGEPLVTKLAAVARYGVLPGAMIAALFYSPPDYALPKKPADSGSSSSSDNTKKVVFIVNLLDGVSYFSIMAFGRFGVEHASFDWTRDMLDEYVLRSNSFSHGHLILVPC
ncbi:hypothetical protein Pfo_016593 [Paulownia fortunei]|nr:hypothetical protein Pfo_016593 [Paulownia fortunei]